MKTAADKKTGELLPDHDLAGERPRKPTASERVMGWRNNKNLRALTLNLPAELVEEFHTKRRTRGHTANQAIETLLRTQYLRKR